MNDISNEVSPLKILITGAMGVIGKLLVAKLEPLFPLVLIDLQPAGLDSKLQVHQIDISDYQAFRPFCDGIDTILHLAANADPKTPWETLLKNNIIGCRNVFEAAADAGCKRIIYSASAHSVAGYPKDVQVNVNQPVRPLSVYGSTKAFGESLGAYYAYQRNMQVLCLRLGWVLDRHDKKITMTNSALDLVLTHEDTIRLFMAALQAPHDIRYGIFNGLSNNRYKRLNTSETTQMLNYHPQDDAFQLAQQNDRSLKRICRKALGKGKDIIGIQRHSKTEG